MSFTVCFLEAMDCETIPWSFVFYDRKYMYTKWLTLIKIHILFVFDLKRGLFIFTNIKRARNRTKHCFYIQHGLSCMTDRDKKLKLQELMIEDLKTMTFWV